MLHSSNPTFFEWDGSPIVYKTSAEWEAVRAALPTYFQPRAGLWHYVNMIVGHFSALQGESVKLKKYFYALRPLLACRHILRERTPPPVPFFDLVERELDPALRETVDELLRLKIASPELGEGKRIDELNAYIEKNLPELRQAAGNLDQRQNCGWDGLNRLFLTTLNNVFVQ